MIVLGPASEVSWNGLSPDASQIQSSWKPVRSEVKATRLPSGDQAGVTSRRVDQVNFAVPEGTTVGEATLEIVRETGATQAGTMQVATAAPGLFMVTNYSLTPAAFLEHVQRDGSRISEPLFDCSGTKRCEAVRVAAPPEGSPAYLVFYETGFRNVSARDVKCSIGGYDFPVELTARSETGVDELRVRLEYSRGTEFWQTVYFDPTAEVVLSAGGVIANRVFLLFAAPEPPCVFCR